MYFKLFPKSYYEFKALGGKNILLIDMFVRFKFVFEDVFTKRPTVDYTIRHGDTPDIIAHDYYGSSDWWWLVMLYNDVVNPFNEMPRLGYDYDIYDTPLGEPGGGLPGGRNNESNNRPVAYLERTGGLEYTDFQEGDVLLKAKNISNTALTVSVVGRTKELLSITGPEIDLRDEYKASRKIVKWIPAKREAQLDKNGYSGFSEGDHVVVVGKDSKGFVVPKVWGTIKKYYNNSQDAISHFIQNRSGNVVSSVYNILTQKQSNFSINTVKGDSTYSGITDALQNTLISGFMGMCGAGTTWDDDYTAMTYREADEGMLKTKLKLLDKSYKQDAYQLLRKMIKEQSRYEETATSRFGNIKKSTINITGSGDTTTSRIY